MHLSGGQVHAYVLRISQRAVGDSGACKWQCKPTQNGAMPSPNTAQNEAKVEIVPLLPHLAEAFHACLDAVARESLMLGQHAAPEFARVHAFVAGNAEAGHPQFAAWDGAQVLGWCDAIPQWAEGLRHRGQLGMGVLAGSRRQGLGDALLAATLAAARRGGRLVRIDLEVRADNGPAVRLYQRHGFQLEGRRAMGLCHRGVYFETVEMGLIL